VIHENSRPAFNAKTSCTSPHPRLLIQNGTTPWQPRKNISSKTPVFLVPWYVSTCRSFVICRRAIVSVCSSHHIRVISIEYDRTSPVSLSCRKRWFYPSPELDAYWIREFSSDFDAYRHEKLLNQPGEYCQLEENPLGSLSLTILYSHFPRAQLRHKQRQNNGILTPMMVVNSHLGPKHKVVQEACLEATYTAMHHLHPLRFDPIERQFFFLPMLDVEALSSQRVAVARIADLVEEAQRIHRPYLNSVLDYAKAHQDVINRFNRFPQRNLLLGRKNTADEELYLATEGKDWEKLILSTMVVSDRGKPQAATPIGAGSAASNTAAPDAGATPKDVKQ